MRHKSIAAIGAIAVVFLLATNPVVADAAKQITGKQIKNNSVAGKDIKDNSVKGADVKAESLTGADINGLTGADINGLTGADIDETTLSIPGKAGVKKVMGIHFHPRSDTSTRAYFGVGGITRATGSDLFVAPLDLPNGAVITTVTFHSLDNAAGNNTGYLTTYTPSTQGFQDVTSASTTAASATPQNTVLTPNAVVDNTLKSYNLLFNFAANDDSAVLYGATVAYTFDATLGSGAKPLKGPSTEAR